MSKPDYIIFIIVAMIFFWTSGYVIYNSEKVDTMIVYENTDDITPEDYADIQNEIKNGAVLAKTEYNFSESYSKLNINIADIDALCALDGIGENIAQRIINYRQINGNFKTIDELMMVNGIGKKKFEAIKTFITVGGEQE